MIMKKDSKDSRVILQVDTDMDARKVVQDVSNNENIKLVFASDGQEGLDIARDILPNLIIIRKNAPVLDALSFSVLFKQSNRTAQIPIIVVCSDTTDEEKKMFVDAGCNGCIADPFNHEEVLHKIKEWI